MPKRIAAVDDQTLLREAGHLSPQVLLLPRQVAFLTGLSVDMLAERMRTRPPKPPYPEPREKPRSAIWYSLGSIHEYRVWLARQAEANEIAMRRLPTFSAWLERAPTTGERYPFALVGPSRRPVDVWLTIRGEIALGRQDRIRWMKHHEFEQETFLAGAHEDWWAGRSRSSGTRIPIRKHRAGSTMASPPAARAE